MWSLALGVFSRFKTQIIMGILVAVIGAAAYFYWNYSQNKIQELVEANSVKEVIIKTQSSTIKKLTDTIADIQKAQRELDKKFNKFDEEVEDLLVLFSEHDLGYLASKKPKLIEIKVNKAVKKLLDEIEQITKPEEQTENEND